jgi:hypothetical protein
VPCDVKLETCTGPGVNKEPGLGNGDHAQTAPAEKEAPNKSNETLNSIGNMFARKHTRFWQLTKVGEIRPVGSCEILYLMCSCATSSYQWTEPSATLDSSLNIAA